VYVITYFVFDLAGYFYLFGHFLMLRSYSVAVAMCHAIRVAVANGIQFFLSPPPPPPPHPPPPPPSTKIDFPTASRCFRGVTQIYCSAVSFKPHCHLKGNGAQSDILSFHFLHSFIISFEFVEKRIVQRVFFCQIYRVF